VETINMIEVAGGEMTACDPSKVDTHRERRERFAVRNIYLKEPILIIQPKVPAPHIYLLPAPTPRGNLQCFFRFVEKF